MCSIQFKKSQRIVTSLSVLQLLPTTFYVNSLYQKLIVYETDSAWITLTSGRGVRGMSVALRRTDFNVRARSLSIAMGHWPWCE